MSRHHSVTAIDVTAPVRLHCGHDGGMWSLSVDDTTSVGIDVYLRGTPGELEQFAYAILQIAAGLTVQEVAP